MLDDERSRRRVAAIVLTVHVLVACMAFVRGMDGMLWLAIVVVSGFVFFLLTGTHRGGEAYEVSISGTPGECPRGGPNAPVAVVDGRADDPRAVRAQQGTKLADQPEPASVWYRLGAAVVTLPLLWMLLRDIGHNPVGLFCDEAEIGLHTRALLNQGLDGFRPPLFYPHFDYPHLGALPLYASASVIWLLGLSDVSIRLVSVVWSIAAILALVALVRRLGWRHGEIAVVLFACAPVFLHMSRINFGHAPSMFCVCVGLYAYARARDEHSIRWALLCGVAFGLSVYGYPGYYLATPVIVAGLAIGEVAASRAAWSRYRSLGITAVAMMVTLTPVVVRAVTDDRFMTRFVEKDDTGAPLLSIERLLTAIDNYPKYFSTKYLFTVGETGLPGGFVSRHSVPGAGLLSWIALPLVVLGVIAIFCSGREGRGRTFAVAGLAILVLYPLPDLATTTRLNPPYTFAVFPTMIFVPLLAGYGIHWASGWCRERWSPFWSSRLVPAGLAALILLGAMQFYTGPYERYPEVSAGYYGWQYGARQSIEGFQARAFDYDRYVLDPDFNQAVVFLDFYLADDPQLRERATVGSIDRVNWQQDSLFAIRAERFDRLMTSGDLLRRYVHVLEVIRFPDGEIALYLVAIGLHHQRPTATPW